MARAAEIVWKEIDSLCDELVEAGADRSCGAGSWESTLAEARVAGRVRNRIEAAFTRVVGDVDSSGAFGMDRAATARSWLTWALHISQADAGATVANGRALVDMPATAAAFSDGSIGSAQARQLRDARRVSPKVFARDEALLVGQAQALRCDLFGRAVKHWAYLADPDQGERHARRQHDLRHLSCSRTFQDSWALDGMLDPVDGTIFSNELERLERLEFAKDWKAAEQALGRKPLLSELGRTPGQRRADAAVEMARRSHDLPDGTPRSRPLVTVVIDHPTLGRICQLADGTVITPGQALPLFCDCDIERVVFGADSRVIDVGQRSRFFTGATRRGVEIRDLECTHVTCDEPYEDCEIDHIIPWSLGGLTAQGNGRVHCPHHNRSRPRSQIPDPDDDDPDD